MKISVDLADSDAKIARGVTAEIRTRLNAALHAAAAAIRSRVAELSGRLVAGSDEYASLVHGELLGELGIPDVSARVAAVVAAVGRGVMVNVTTPRVVGGRIEGGLTVGILRSDYEDILSLAEASYVSAPSGAEIPWLRWLTVGGDQVLVFGYGVTHDLAASQKARSRTGLALMTKGSGWRVPPEFSGREGANWLTRAFDVGGIEGQFMRIFQEELDKRL